MTLDPALLDILCCPTTRRPLEVLSGSRLEHLNRLVGERKIKRQDGTPVEQPFEQALVTRDGAIDGLSIGFRTLLAARDRASGHRRIAKVDLWEVSLVTFPMLAGARVSAPGERFARRLAVARRGAVARWRRPVR